MMEEIANENLSILIQKLFLDKKLAEKFSKCKTLDEFYDFCIGIQKGYTKEELKDTLDMLGSVDWKNLKEETGDLGDDNLVAVAGGANISLPNKLTAGILSLLSLCSVSFSNGSNAYAADDGTQIQSQTQTQTSATTGSILQKLKDPKVSRVLKCLAVAAGAALIIGTTVYFARRSITPNKPIGEANIGIKNPGNACYINASLQQLYSISEFRIKVMNYPTGQDIKIDALKTFFKSLDSGKSLDDKVRDKSLRDLGYDGTQQDAYEFLCGAKFIGDVLEKLDFKVDAHAIDPLGYSSVKDYFKDEKIFVDASAMFKDQIVVPFSQRPCDCGKKDFRVSKEVEVFGGKKRLTGAIVKTGSKDGGHYYSYKVMSNGKWYCFNDSSVYAVSEQTVIRDMQENGRILVYSS